MCKRDGLFLPSYPIDDMELSHLQRAAICPYRWKTLFQTKGVDPMKLKDSRPLPIAAQGGRIYGHGAYLIPGGRFCVAYTHEDAEYIDIEVWDFGPPGSRPLESPRLTASHREHLGSAQYPEKVSISVWAEREPIISMAVSEDRAMPQNPDLECMS